MKSPHSPREWGIQKSKSPHFPHHKGRNLLQSPHKFLVFPHISPGSPPLGEAHDKCIMSILTLHNQYIDFANVKISNRCAHDLRLSCTFVVDTLLNRPTPFYIILKYLNQHILRKRLQASSCFT